MKSQQSDRRKHFLLFIIVLFASFPSGAHKVYRTRRRTTPPPETDDDLASRAIIGRINASGHAVVSPRLREIIRQQHTRKLGGQSGGYIDLNYLSGDGSSGVTVNCPKSCTPREILKQIRVETIKLDILRKLRLSSPPNMTNHRLPDIPFVRNLIERNYQQHDSPFDDAMLPEDYDPDADHSTMIQTIIFPNTDSSSSSSSFVNFSFSTKLLNSEVVNASFGVYVKRTGNESIPHPALQTFVFLHKVKADGKTEAYLKKRIPAIYGESGHWVQFDVKRVAREWVERPNSNHGLKVVLIGDSHRHYNVVINPQNPDDEPYKPFLDMSVREKARSRRSITAMTCEERSSERRCCRYPLVIDFESFRWDWVIAPRSYHAYYCSGDCPFSYYQMHSVNTHVVQQVRFDGTNGGPCCSPRDLSPISLLYFDPHMNIINGVLPGMVVNRCTCS